MKCPKCGSQSPDYASKCSCGYEFGTDIDETGVPQTSNGSKQSAEKIANAPDSAVRERQTEGFDWQLVAVSASVLGALLGVAIFLQSIVGVGATIGKVLGGIVFVVGIVTFLAWKGKKKIWGLALLGAVGGIVCGILSSVF
jgi:predicted ATP-dependent serine protease